MKRRTFITFAAGAGVGVAVSPIAPQLTDDLSIWTQNWPWVPKNPKGENIYAKTTSKLCPTACGIKIRSVKGQALRALSLPEHPLGGGISALAAAELQLLHSPARVQKPLLRKSDGSLVQVTWAEALEILGKKLKEAGSDIACVSGDETGTSSELLSAFLAHVKSDRMFFMPSEGQCATRAWEELGGQGQPGYALENSDFILAVGADVLDSWGTAIRNRRIFGQKRPAGGDRAMKFFHAGPVQAGSAAVADRWIQVRPGGETVLLLGLIGQAIKAGKHSDRAGFTDLQGLTARITPARVERVAGVSTAQQKELLDALLAASSPLVLAGSAFNSGSGALPLLAAFSLNMLLGASGKTIKALPIYQAGLRGAQTRSQIYKRDLAWFLNAGLVSRAKAMIFYDANPAYALPNAGAVAAALKEVPFKVSFSAFYDETAQLCDLVIPCTAGIERLDDVQTPYGCGKVFYSLCRPLAAPATDSRNGLDVLVDVANKQLGAKLPAYASLLESKAEAMRVTWDDEEDLAVRESMTVLSLEPMRFNAKALGRAVRNAGESAELILAPVSRNAMGTAQTGIPPFNLKTVRDSELLGKEMFVMLNRATAAKLRVRQGDLVKVSSGSGELAARVNIFEGIMPGCVGVNAGFGHTALDQFSRDKGGNAFELMTAVKEDETGLSSWSATAVSITRV